MDVEGDVSSVFFLLKLKELIGKRKRIKNELRTQKLREKSPDSKNLKNKSLDYNEITNNSANIDCKEIKYRSVNIDCKEIKYSTENKTPEIRIFNKIDLMPSKIPITFEPIIRTQSPTNDEKIQFVFTSHYKKRNEMCELCGVIIRRANMETHMNMHLNRKPYVCNFKNCGRSYTSPSTLSRHRKLHTLSKEFTCDICSAKFYFGANLRKHKESHLEPKFKCMICDHMFKTTETLKSHMYKHKDSENLTCTHPSCDRKLKNTISLREHLRRFHKIRVRERVAK